MVNERGLHPVAVSCLADSELSVLINAALISDLRPWTRAMPAVAPLVALYRHDEVVSSRIAWLQVSIAGSSAAVGYFEYISKGSSPGLMSADAYHWHVHCILLVIVRVEAVGQRRGMLLALLEPPPIIITNWHIEASSCDRVHDIQGTITSDQFIYIR
jgi:hypothetical protein